MLAQFIGLMEEQSWVYEFTGGCLADALFELAAPPASAELGKATSTPNLTPLGPGRISSALSPMGARAQSDRVQPTTQEQGK